jgi:hypothetical protein
MIHFQSWPSIEKYKFRLGSVVSGLAPLRTLSARVLERSGILTDQILGAFGPKLKELEITGPLHTITTDAFEGIESYELKLSIRGTNIKSLPAGRIKFNWKRYSEECTRKSMEAQYLKILLKT